MNSKTLSSIAVRMDRWVQAVAPKLPGIESGGVFRYSHQPILRVDAWIEPGAFTLHLLGLELVLDRATRKAPRVTS